MKKAVKRTLAAALSVLLLTGALTGCFSGANSSQGQTGSQTESSVPAEKIRLRIVHDEVGTSTKAEWMKWLFGQFNEKYGDKVALDVEEIAGEDDMIEKMKIYLSTNELPDISPYGVNLSYDLAVAGKTVDLTPYLDANPDIKNGISKMTMEKNTYNGKVFGIAVSTSQMYMYVNKDLFAKAGADTKFDSWEDFWGTLDKLKASGIKYPVCLETAGNAWTSGLMLGGFVAGASNEGFEFMNTANPKTFQNDAMKKGLADVTTLLKKYAAPNAVGGDYATAEANFMKEEAAILINGTWVIPHFSDPRLVSIENFADKTVQVAFPGNMIYKTPNYGFTICSKDKEHADAAWKLLEIAAGKESQAKMMLCSGDLPENSDVEVDDATREKYPMIAAAYEEFSDAKTIQGYTRIWPSAVVDELAAGLPALVHDSMTADEVIQRMDAAAADAG